MCWGGCLESGRREYWDRLPFPLAGWYKPLLDREMKAGALQKLVQWSGAGEVLSGSASCLQWVPFHGQAPGACLAMLTHTVVRAPLVLAHFTRKQQRSPQWFLPTYKQRPAS